MVRIHEAPHPDMTDVPLEVSDEILNYAKEYNRRYLHWAELEHRVPEGMKNDVWRYMKHTRHNISTDLHVCGVEFKYSILPSFLDILHKMDIVARRELTDDIGKYERDAMYNMTALDESVSSSQIEGAAVSSADAKAMLMDRIRPRNTDEKMIENNHNAMMFVRTLNDEPFTIGTIKRLHSIITEGTLDPEYVGGFRKSDDIVVMNPADGTVYHEPPSHVHIENMMQDLCGLANDPSMHPVIKAVIIHFLIGYIHPFHDGNGRTARALFYWSMLKDGYDSILGISISEEIKSSRKKYGLAYQYTETDDNDLTYFLKYNLERLDIGAERLKDTIRKSEKNARNSNMLMFAIPQLNRLKTRILNDMLSEFEVMSLAEAQVRYGISYETARSSFSEMESSGIIRLSRRDRKKQYYSVDPDGLIELLKERIASDGSVELGGVYEFVLDSLF